jgi:hypothetical protein
VDDLVKALERERLAGMPRWRLVTLAPDHSPADHSIIPDLPTDLHAAEHRRDITDEPAVWSVA